MPFSFSNVESSPFLVHRAYSREGLICKNEFLGGGLFEGRAYLKVGAYSRTCVTFLELKQDADLQ